MAWRYTGKARVDPNNPQAFGVCDRCSFWFNLVNLGYQREWRGPRLVNTRARVCAACMDKPFIFNKPIIYPPDPVPVRDPRPQNFEVANNGSPFTPPLPWPVQPSGPVVQEWYVLADDGDIILDDAGRPILVDGSPFVPEPPVYVTPPLPALPQEIEQDGYSEP